jgi:ABC-2 type transport system permease protein
MGSIQRIVNLILYEWRRSIAKKKIHVLVILSLVLQVGVFALFNYLFANPPPGFTIIGFSLDELKGTMWLLGMLGPQSLFIPLITMIVAGGSMSEEYEHGTADILLSKPITRIEYMAGKYLGGFSLLIFAIALITTLGVTLAYGFFGPQESIQFVPVVYLALVYANLLFFSLAFMFSEVLRRSTLAILAALGIYVASTVLGSYLSILYAITRQQLYQDISMWLPNWSVSNFPSFLVSELMTVHISPFITVASGNIQLAGGIIAAYAIISIIATAFRLVRSDVTKKSD